MISYRCPVRFRWRHLLAHRHRPRLQSHQVLPPRLQPDGTDRDNHRRPPFPHHRPCPVRQRSFRLPSSCSPKAVPSVFCASVSCTVVSPFGCCSGSRCPACWNWFRPRGTATSRTMMVRGMPRNHWHALRNCPGPSGAPNIDSSRSEQMRV